jgi:hypothetical protein
MRRFWIVCAAGVALLLVVGLAIAGAVALFGNSVHGTINQDRLEAEIYNWAVTKQNADHSINVQCPDEVPIKAGSTFHYIISGGSRSVRLAVTIENNDGDVTWVVG